MMNQTKKHTTSKKLLALLLALIMTVSLLPMSVFAAAVDVPETEPQVTEPVEEDVQEPEVTDVAVEGDGSVDDANNGIDMFAAADEEYTLRDIEKFGFIRIFHLDCGRKYFSVSEIEGIIDQLAENHYTHIQLAFGNDGLRFLLDDMEVTANGTTYTSEKVTSAIKSGNSSLTSGSSGELSETQMDAIIKYAADKGIEVIPMFNVPGHMTTVVKAMNTLNVGGKSIQVSNNTDARTSNWAIDPTDETAVNFAVALASKYVQYFSDKGCTMFNIGADESGLSTSNYLSYAKLVNTMSLVVKKAEMTPLAYNDGIYNSSYSSSLNGYEFDPDIIICYWTDGTYIAAASDLAAKGFRILNNTNNWYYVLGDYLYTAWGSDGQWGYNDALNGLKNTKVTQVKSDATGIVPVGSVLCVWSDAPNQTYESNKVYTLIQTMAEQNPDYFKAEETPAEPELVVDTDASTVKPVKQEDGSYTVAVKADETLQLKVANYEGSLTWKSSNTDVATVEDGVVTFTGVAGDVTITAEPAVATRGDDTVFTATFAVTLRIGGDLTNVPDYKAGEVKQTGSSSEYTYVLDTDGVDVGKEYLIVGGSNNSYYALRRNNSNVRTQQVTINGTEATIAAYADTSLWTFSSATRGTIKNGNYYLTYGNAGYSLGVSTSSSNGRSWNISSNGDGTYTISSGYYSLQYTRSSFTLSYGDYNVRLYKKTATINYTVDTTNLKALIDTATKLDPDAFVNWDDVNMDTVLAAANTALTNVNNPYTDKTTAETAQKSVNSAAENLYKAMSELRYRSKKTITVNCVDEAGAAIGDGSYVFYAYENGNGGYDYKFSAPTIGGYKCSRGTVISGTATEDTTLTLTYIKGSFSLPDSVEIPITIVDYRADGLLFDWTYNPDQTGYTNSYRYGLVHGEAQSWGAGTIYSGVTATYNQSTGLYEVNGNNSTGVERIAGTTLQRTGSVYSKTYFDQNSTDNDWSRAGLVKENLGANGMPVYTDATVEYVAGLLEAGYYNKITKNGNSIIYDTFVSASGSRSVNGTSTSAMSTQFSASRTWDNINNAYDLAWYLLNTFYLADSNMTDVIGTDGETHSVPIYGMGVDAYNKIILRDTGNGTYRFDASQGKTKYDTENSAIYEDDSATSDSFYPLENLGYEQPGLLKQTSQVDGKNRNGDFTLRGESQFIYDESANLYFNFKGDDDVYMYINGVLALDLGGAHGSNVKNVKLNDLDKEKYSLEDGKVATFTFFYMERCSDASTFAIETNMALVERGISVTKDGYDTSYGARIASGSVINNETSVAYDLTVSNKGNQEMTQIKFEDKDKFDATISFGYGVVDPVLTNASGNPAFKLGEQAGYALFITDSNGNEVSDSRQTFKTLADLSKAVGEVTLLPEQTLHVRFLQVTADVPSSTMADYENTVKVTAVSGEQTLTDSTNHVLYSYNADDTPKAYVVDFGLPLHITDIFDASSESYFAYPDRALTLNANSSIRYGKLEIGGVGFKTELTYTLKDKTTIDAVERIVLDVAYKFDKTIVNLQKNIRIIPASTVYYEDDFMSFTNKDNSTNVAAATADNGFWYTDGTKPTGTVYQEMDKLGDTNANNYGYDEAYKACTKFSLGSAVKVTVDKDSKGAAGWPYATFTFRGTGFDIISLTDNTSGAIYVYVYKGDSINGERVAGYVVNNYYGYTYSETEGWQTTDEADPNAVYQVPVIKVSDLDYGQYTVKIMVGYSQYQDVANKGEYSFWMDAIRVYDPAGGAADSDYAKDGEQNPDFVELRRVLLDANSFNADTLKNGAVFIDGKGETTVVDDYKNYGPNHEVYLANGQAIAFQLVANGVPAGLQLGAKLANGESGTLAITGASFVKGDVEGKLNLATATDMFYELNGITWKDQSDGTYKSGVITLTNNGTGMISLTNLKLINAKYTEDASAVTNAASDEVLVTMVMDTDAAQEAIAAVDSVLHPQEEVKTFTPERFEASWNRSSVKAGEKATLTVKTSEDVEAITVDGVTIDTYRTRTQRTGWGWNAKKVTYREFTYTITASETADHEIVAVNAEGTASEAIHAVLTVRAAAQRPGIGGWLNKLFSRWF